MSHSIKNRKEELQHYIDDCLWRQRPRTSLLQTKNLQSRFMASALTPTIALHPVNNSIPWISMGREAERVGVSFQTSKEIMVKIEGVKH